MKWKTISSEDVLASPWMSIRRDIVELPNGDVLNDYYVWESSDVALIVPLTTLGEFLMVEQYKHATGEMTLEFPAGTVGAAEVAECAAKRELEEETGYSVQDCRQLAIACDNPTKSTGNLYIFLGVGANKVSEPQLDVSEDIKSVTLNRQEIMTHIQSGHIRVSGSIAAAFLAFKELDSTSHAHR